jgi:hypothetical protein
MAACTALLTMKMCTSPAVPYYLRKEKKEKNGIYNNPSLAISLSYSGVIVDILLVSSSDYPLCYLFTTSMIP